MMSHRAIRHSFVVSVAFYGILLFIAGGGFWIIRHFL